MPLNRIAYRINRRKHTPIYRFKDTTDYLEFFFPKITTHIKDYQLIRKLNTRKTDVHKKLKI